LISNSQAPPQQSRVIGQAFGPPAARALLLTQAAGRDTLGR
jgi:hypothetical protein